MEPSCSAPIAAEGTRELSARQDSSSLLRGKRVLLAEDDASARRVVASTLRTMGLDVVEASDGGRMLVAVTSQYQDGSEPTDVDLIVTDVQMPVLDGLQIFRGVRAAHWTTPTIIVTGHDSPEVQEAATRLGAVVLPKPLDLELLESTVRQLLGPAETRSSKPPDSVH